MPLPFALVRTTSKEPEFCTAGVAKETEVSELRTTFVAAIPPTVTLVTPVRFEPVIVVIVPPDIGPEVTESEAIDGGGGGGKSLLQVTVPEIVLRVEPFDPGSAFARQADKFPVS